MATYQLKVAIDKAWIEKFNTKGMKLCFASCVESSGESNFNVVSYADSMHFLERDEELSADPCH